MACSILLALKGTCSPLRFTMVVKRRSPFILAVIMKLINGNSRVNKNYLGIYKYSIAFRPKATNYLYLAGLLTCSTVLQPSHFDGRNSGAL
jgi:hypothetical protein